MNHESSDETRAERVDAEADQTAGDNNAADGRESEPSGAGRGRWIAAAVAALGVALFAMPLLRGPETSDTASQSSGASGSEGGATCSTSKGPANFDFTLKDIDGADVRLSDYRGKVILLNFWATWCGPCRIEIPEFVEAYDQFRDSGFVILGVLSQDDPTPADLREFANGYGMNYPILREHAELDEAFGPIWAIPTSFIIDRHGSICTKHMGPVSKEMLAREIKRLL